MSNTPETDRLLQSQFIEQGSLGPHNCPEWLTLHARKLERERDEAQSLNIAFHMRIRKLEAGIRNLQNVKGRHNTEIAFKRLVALLPGNDQAQAPQPATENHENTN